MRKDHRSVAENVTIESDIPLPDVDRRRKWAAIAERMQPGDSFLLDSKRAAQSCVRCFKEQGYNAVYRSTHAGFRVWLLNAEKVRDVYNEVE